VWLNEAWSRLRQPTTKTRKYRNRRSQLRLEVLEDRTLPTSVTSVFPTAHLVEVGVQDPVRATFDVALNPATVNTNTVLLQDSSGHGVPASVSYDGNVTVTLTPTSALNYTATYTATLVGGSGGIKDTNGNPLAANYTWTYTTANPPSQDGQFTQPISFPIVAIHVALLATGNVVMWQGEDNGGPSATEYNPNTGTFTPVPELISNIFCAGFSALPDGRIMVLGGYGSDEQGNPVTEIFNPFNNSWTQGPSMEYSRWYGSATTLPSGKILATSGTDLTQVSYITEPEIYDPIGNTWSQLDNAQFSSPSYPFMFVLPNGELLNAGSAEQNGNNGELPVSMILNTATQTWTTVDANPIDGSTAVMYLPGKVMKSGSAYFPTTSTSTPAANTTFVMDATQSAPQWQQTSPMHLGRGFQNLTLLPTGEVLSTGGETTLDGVVLANAVYPSEIWNPTTQTWRLAAGLQIPRLYHSTGLLLPDGRVLVAGGGKDFNKEQANETSAEIYSPPYLFQGPRPTIAAAPATLSYNSTFFLQTPDAANIASVVLMRPGTDTHGFNFDQSYVPLTFQQATGGLNVQAPANPNLAVPSYYMLFIVNKSGVPSVAAFTQLPVPFVGEVSPANGAVFASGGTTITATFDQPTGIGTINANTFTLTDQWNNVVPATVTFDTPSNTATLTPINPLLNGANYTATISVPTPYSWTFSTAPLVDSFSPASGATLVNPSANLTVHFNEAVDPTTINTSTIQLQDPSNHVVPATVTYDPHSQTAVLVPAAALGNASTYTIFIQGGSTGVKDSQERAMSGNVLSTFTTRPTVVNPIVAENALPGTPQSVWDLTNGGDTNIQGFTTDISVDHGQTVYFKINTNSTHYRIDIYRMGYYGGNGARLITTMDEVLSTPQLQPAPIYDPSTGLFDAGNWSVSASWSVPASAVSGIYFAKLTREDGTAGANQIFFVVRDDEGHSDLLFKASDATWQAYNDWGGQAINEGTFGNNRAFAVSYNRPFDNRQDLTGLGQTSWVMWSEYPMVRWLEANGYDVSYFTDVDAARSGSDILQHKAFLSVGHDAYWSTQEFDNVLAARNAGVNLAFFSGSTSFWETRWTDSIDGTLTPYRTMIAYQETLSGGKIDPQPDLWTGTWRDPRFSPPANGGLPENSLVGSLFMVGQSQDALGDPLLVPAADGALRFWRNTSLVGMAPGSVASVGTFIVGYQWNEDLDNGFRPAGLVDMSSSTYNVPQLLLDYGATYGPGLATHSLTLYKANSGALVFSAGTIQWSWGLDGTHDGSASPPDVRIEQATVNLLADMGAQPGSLLAGLVAATASSDRTPPHSVITSALNQIVLQTGVTYTISGTATDSGGGVVAGVEVSLDGGVTWHPAVGTGTWTYSWTPLTPTTTVIKSRATDDSGNIESPGAGMTVTVYSTATTPPQITAVAASLSNIQTAVISWTTDELSTSVVNYGTNPQALTSTVSSSTLVTAHSLTLTGLIANTTYYYRVTSVDPYNNSSTMPAPGQSPAVLALPAYFDTALTDFAKGTFGPTILLTQNGNGEVGLAPQASGVFVGTSLPAGWFSTPWNTGGTATVGGGLLTVDGARAGTTALFGPGSNLEFKATFSGDAGQHVGFGVDFNNAPWAMFSTGSIGGDLYARVNNGTTSQDVSLGSSWLGSAHNFQINWTTTGVVFSIDGNQVASIGLVVATPMRPLVSDFNVGGGVMTVNWLALTPYASTGTYLSRIFDAGQAVTWSTLTWDANTPSGTSLAISVRMGNTPTPDATWTSFVPLAASPATIGGVSRYLQYQASLTTSDSTQTPQLLDVSINNTLAADTVPPHIVSESPAAGATGASLTGPITITFSELMNPATFTGATFKLQAVGGSAVTATVSYAGSTATLQPTASLTADTQYQATIGGSVTDTSGNALGTPFTWTFTTASPSFTDTSVADFTAGTTGANTYISQINDGEVILTPTVGTEFSGTMLPTGWYATVWNPGGTAVVSGGVLTINGARAGTTTLYGPGSSLQFSANFSGDAAQNVGFGVDFNSAPWAMFSTSTGGALYARVNNGTSFTDTLLGSNWLGAFHLFRIDWTTTGVNFSIDESQVASDAITIAASMGPLASDYNVGGGNLTVDWMHLSPYVVSGTYQSRVFDSGTKSTWNTISWDSQLPAATSLTVSVRTGNTPTPDGTWTAFTQVAGSGAAIGVIARYFQYQVALATNDPTQTPVLQDVTVTYINNYLTANAGNVTTNENTAVNGNLSITEGTAGSLTYTVVNQPQNGTVSVNSSTGAFTYTPTTEFYGTDSFTFQATGSGLTSNVATESVTVNAVNDAPTANPVTVTLPDSGAAAVPLSGSDEETAAANLIFTVKSLPVDGTLLRPDGTAAHVGDTFTGSPTNLTYDLQFAFGNVTDTFTYTATDTGAPPGSGTNALTSAPATVTINTPANSAGIVRVGGTASADTIVVAPTTNGKNLQVTFNGQIISNTIALTSITGIHIYGQGGNDAIQLTNKGIASTVVTGTGNSTLTLTGPSGVTTITGGAGSNTLALTDNTNFTLTNTTLTTADGTSLTLSGIGTANLTGGTGNNTFDVSGWTGGGRLGGGGGGTDTVVATKNANFTLTNVSLSTSDNMNLSLSGITVANLTGTTSGDDFVLNSWTHTGTITGTSSGTINVTKNANFTLTNSALTTSDGMSLTLANIGIAVLVSGVSQSTMNASAYTGIALLAAGTGGATLIGGPGINVLIGGAGVDTINTNGNGRDLLIGGSGADAITANSGSDILIGGTTSYYDETTGAINSTALKAIMTEWISTKPYMTRVNDLLNGGGLNGSYVLNSTTVFADAGANVLNGGPAGDWFLYEAGDAITGYVTGEIKTLIGSHAQPEPDPTFPRNSPTNSDNKPSSSPLAELPFDAAALDAVMAEAAGTDATARLRRRRHAGQPAVDGAPGSIR
jgi:hypothetical protein